MARVTDATMDLLLFIDNEAESISHALRIAAETNRKNATEAGGAGLEWAVALLNESADSWDAKADRLDELVECLPEELGY